MEIAKSLGLPLRGTGWIDHLAKQTTKAAFKKLRGEMCHVHAEIQMLLYQNSFPMSPDEQGKNIPTLDAVSAAVYSAGCSFESTAPSMFEELTKPS